MKLVIGIVAVLAVFAAAAQTPLRVGIADPDLRAVEGPVSPSSDLVNSQVGPVVVNVKLLDPPLVVAVGANAKQNGITMTPDQQRAYLAQLKQKQDAVMAQIRALGGVELGRVGRGHNALIVSMEPSQMTAARSIDGVASVRRSVDSQLLQSTSHPDLKTTLGYLGAGGVHSTGVRGQGIRVAMLDSGIDYTHYNLGGSGLVADYNAAKAAAAGTPPANLFPTSKVIGGYDFVGDVWPCPGQTGPCPLLPDSNPIDISGHGTSTADTLSGHSSDNLHVGMAPASQLYAVKVCSSTSASCSGVAILQGIDFALDPNNTGTLNQAVDIISMSLGAAFGQREDDASEMLTDVVNFGVVCVVSAGNDGNIPYVLGGPAAAPEVLAVAATRSVVDFSIPLVINSPASIAGTYTNTAILDFAPIHATVNAGVVFVGRGCPAGSTGAGSPDDPYLANPSGKIALIDRGVCDISLKIDRAATAGAVGVLIGLVAAGDAIPFSPGAGSNFVPSLVITQATSNLIKNALATSAVNATLSPNNAIFLARNIASYSSRGPNYSYNVLKPDLSAPGTVSVAAAGSGNGEQSVDGTSFACPLVAGTAALLLSKTRSLGPLDVKAILMETSEPAVFNNGTTQPGVLAPISRAGAGELRADRAVAGSTSVWDAGDPLAVSLSFGTYRLNTNQSYRKKVVIRNYSDTARTYQIANTYRLAPNTTGVTLTAPPSVFVPANGAASFNLTANVSVPALPAWTPNGGSGGGNGELLNAVEYAGYLNFTSGSESVHIPWHILPHKAANVSPGSDSLILNGSPKTLSLSNLGGAVGGPVTVYSLTGTGIQFPPSALPGPGAEFAAINLRAVGVRLFCIDSGCTNMGVAFAVTTFGERAHPDVPARFNVDIDINNDGVYDVTLYNAGAVTNGVLTGENVGFVLDIAANTTVSSGFFTTTDLNSANATLTSPLSALKTKSGLQLRFDAPFTFRVRAIDNYFGGGVRDQIGPMQYELDMPQYYASSEVLTVPANSSTPIQVLPNNADNVYFTGPYNGKSPSQKGLLLMLRNARTAQEAALVAVTP